MLDELVLKELGIQTFIVNDYAKFKVYSQDAVNLEIYHSLPIFALIYEEKLAKAYLYNLYGYLKSLTYPVFGVYSANEPNFTNEQKSQLVVVGPSISVYGNDTPPPLPIDIQLEPTDESKKAFWVKIQGYLKKYSALNLPRIPQNAHIYLDSYLISNPKTFGKWVLNLCGFLEFNKIKVEYVLDQDIAKLPKSSLVITAKDSQVYPMLTQDKDRKYLVVDEKLSYDDQKKELFKQLLAQKYLKRDEQNANIFTIGEMF